jgi:hypothetical protein
MSSLAGKMSMLVDSYNHSKNSPAYRELSIKYRTLKNTNQELIQLLTHLFSGLNQSRAPQKTSNKPKRRLRRAKSTQVDVNHEEKEDQSIAIDCSVSCNEIKLDTNDLLSSDAIYDDGSYIQNDSEDEFADDECDDEHEDIDIKQQIIAETEAESFAVSDENIQIEVEEVEEFEEEVEEIEVEEEEKEVEEFEEEVEEIEVEEFEEVEEEEVEEFEEVEEEVEEFEEVEEEVEEFEEVEEEVEEEEVEEVEEVELEEEEESGVYEIEINGTRYYTTNEQNGIVYSLVDEDDVGDEIGKFVNGKFVLN